VIRALFVCGRGRTRGPTAAQVFEDWPGVRTDFGGVLAGADDALAAEQIAWATEIFAMEQRHARHLQDRFARPLRGKRVITLAIRDEFGFMDARLVEALLDQAGPHLRRAG